MLSRRGKCATILGFAHSRKRPPTRHFCSISRCFIRHILQVGCCSVSAQVAVELAAAVEHCLLLRVAVARGVGLLAEQGAWSVWPTAANREQSAQ